MTAIVFIGLGNPGKNYARTRHNLGFLVVEAFAEQLGMTLRENKSFRAAVAKGRWDKAPDTEIHLLLPLTYMNESGQAVRQYLDYYKMNPSQVVVICDDIALELGQLRVRRSGSPGGHNGLSSVSVHLATQGFLRLRMGVGNHLEESQSLADYVLSAFKLEELATLDESIKRGVAALKLLITEPIAKVMSQCNTKIRLGE